LEETNNQIRFYLGSIKLLLFTTKTFIGLLRGHCYEL
jgi:hypothetical protein